MHPENQAAAGWQAKMDPEPVSIIIPACNEEANLKPLLERIDEAFRKNGLSGEVIVVDDGSTDGTWPLLQSLSRAYPYLRPIRHQRNMGITAAISTATSLAKNEKIVFLPSDLQSDPREDVPKLLSRMQEGNYDIVVGRRDSWNRSPAKIIESKIYSLLLRILFGVPVSDFNWVRAFKKKTMENLHLRKDWHRYFVVLSASRGFHVGEVGVREYSRAGGKSKFNAKRVLTGFLDLLVIWFYLRFTKKPMLFFGTLGIAALSAGVLLGFALTYLYLTGSQEVTTRPVLFLLTILVITGFQSLIFGFLAELQVTGNEEMHARFEEMIKKP